MTRKGIVFVTALLVAPGVVSAVPSKAGRSAKSGKSSTPAASAEEIAKLKGQYKWGMKPEEVQAAIEDQIRASYQEKLATSAHDPTRNNRLRKEMTAEVEKVKGNLIKFDDQKTGYDVSIVDQEFLRNAGESMLVAKEENGTRYFFFRDNLLYKMYLAFDKEILQGKSFRDFGKQMQKRFGKAREVTVEERTKAGVKVKLDHFLWTSKDDTLRLVDRSEFYDVYCLVISDSAIGKQQAELRQGRAAAPKSDTLIDAVTAPENSQRDANDDIIDRISGKPTPKPGEQPPEDIKVPPVSPTAPTPTNVRNPDL
jgi:hypothetical protein